MLYVIFLCFSFIVFLYSPTPSCTAMTRHFMKSNSSPKPPHILTTLAPTQFFIFAKPLSESSFKDFIRATRSGGKASKARSSVSRSSPITLQTPCGRSFTTCNQTKMATEEQETYSLSFSLLSLLHQYPASSYCIIIILNIINQTTHDAVMCLGMLHLT